MPHPVMFRGAGWRVLRSTLGGALWEPEGWRVRQSELRISSVPSSWHRVAKTSVISWVSGVTGTSLVLVP